jgi:type IX secretion system PorP/SprF family membrane protein
MISRKNKFYFLSTIVLLNCLNVKSQDIHFSQFFASPVLLNPAAAGANNSAFRFAANYRNQWKSVISPFKTFALAFDSKFYPSMMRRNNRTGNYIGYGITLFNDKVGLSKLTTNQLSIDLSYFLNINNNSSLSAGIKTGFFQKSINTGNLKWDSQYDGRGYDASLSSNENTVYQNFIKFDLGAGLLYKYQQIQQGVCFELGTSMAHITKPNNSFYNNDPSLNYKYIVHSLFQTKISSNTYLIPTALFALQGNHSELTAGANIKFMLDEAGKGSAAFSNSGSFASAIQFGTFYRLKDALIFMAALEYKHYLTFGISYDVNVSRLTRASRYRGGIEFSLILIQPKKSKLRTKY